jgi:hypothetical protein
MSYYVIPYHAIYHIPCHILLCHITYTYLNYHVILYHTLPHYTIPIHTIPYHTIPYHTIPYHTIPYHTIPYHTIPSDVLVFNPGDAVPTDEQVASKDQHRQSGVFDNSTQIGSPASAGSGSPVAVSLSNDERKKFDDERVKLFVQLDEKVSSS